MNNGVGRVFIPSQYVAFTERALMILQLHQNREVESTHKGIISIFIKNNEVIFNLLCMA